MSNTISKHCRWTDTVIDILYNIFGGQQESVKEGGQHMSYDVLEICRYVIKYSNDMGYGVSNLKLQKLLYFIQVTWVVRRHASCFDEDIVAWDFGPVVPRAYREYKSYGGMDIYTRDKYWYEDPKNPWNSRWIAYPECTITDQDKDLINKVVDHFRGYSATSMLRLTHQQSPWIDAYKKGNGTVITNESLWEYFHD